MKRILFFFLIVFALTACDNNNSEQTLNNGIAPPAVLNYTVVKVYPHNPSSFTEGLEWHDSTLYESTGEYGESKLLRVDLKTGKSLQQINLAKEFFGEGITVINGKLYQLTYQTGKCFVYDFKTFKKISERALFNSS